MHKKYLSRVVDNIYVKFIKTHFHDITPRMTLHLNRRSFIQKTLHTGGIVSLSCLGIVPFAINDDVASCFNCGYPGKGLPIGSSAPSLYKRYCSSCGIDQTSKRFDAATCSCKEASLQTADKVITPPCCRVPFPVKEVAGQMNKPSLSLASLTF